MTKLELMKLQKKLKQIADTTIFATPYENAIWDGYAKFVAVYGISQWGLRKSENALMRLSRMLNVPPEKILDDSDTLVSWFNQKYDDIYKSVN